MRDSNDISLTLISNNDIVPQQGPTSPQHGCFNKLTPKAYSSPWLFSLLEEEESLKIGILARMLNSQLY